MDHEKLMKVKILETHFLKFILFIILFERFKLSGLKEILPNNIKVIADGRKDDQSQK